MVHETLFTNCSGCFKHLIVFYFLCLYFISDFRFVCQPRRRLSPVALNLQENTNSGKNISTGSFTSPSTYLLNYITGTNYDIVGYNPETGEAGVVKYRKTSENDDKKDKEDKKQKAPKGR